MCSDNKNINPITLAIFPFENFTDGEAWDVFCKSFCFDLITELSRFRQFQVIAYQSVKDLGKVNHQENEAFTKLHTDYTIQGSFRHNKNVLIINLQIINSHTQQVVWAERFERKSSELIAIQEDVLRQVVASLQQQLNYDLLSQIKKKPKIKLKAYECWLYGIHELKKGSLESDEKARAYFQQAMAIDPSYSLAYSGMSLTYFNEWSCQLWDRWEVSQNGAYTWAEKAIQLDDQNYVAAYVLGRVFLYEGAYESSEFYLRKSLQLNSNDPDSLICIASCFMYLGFSEEALSLYEKALKLNPANGEHYYPIGAFILFELGKYEEAILLSKKAKNIPWLDAHVFFSAMWFELGDDDKMNYHWNIYFESYLKVINKGKDCSPQEAVEWMMKINPYRNKTNLEAFWQYITKGNATFKNSQTHDTVTSLKPCYFLKKGGLWKFSFDNKTIHLPEVKGFYDLQKLLAQPENPYHCAELMGSVLDAKSEPLIDEKAKKAYQEKIRSLQEEIEEAETDHDFQRSAQLQAEYDQLLEHLSQSLRLKRTVRKSGDPVEKARSALTWRIRSAISKIEKSHPALGKHLSNAVKTGTFCSYKPEQTIHWLIE